MKACTKCGEAKPADEFVARASRSKYQSWCRSCKNELKYEWVAKNKEYVKKYSTARRVGLTVEEYDALDLSACEICAAELSVSAEKKTSSKPFLDHDHATGEFRGVLCCRCNSMLGFARDSVDLLYRAVRYLEGQ